MFDLHYIQLRTIEELLFKKEATFTQLNALNLTNDHFTFHIKQLIKRGLIEKVDDLYKLTSSGLELAGRLNTNKGTIYNQAKLSILVGIFRENNGTLEVLLSKRKRDQSIGKIAWHTTKVDIGELLKDSANRCLKNETGLTGNPEFAGVTHVIRKDENNYEIDVVLVDFLVLNPTGELITETPDQTNFWISYEDALKLDNTLVGMKEKLEAFKNRQITFNEYIN